MLTQEQKKMYEQICQHAITDLKEVDRQIEAELVSVKRRLIELQDGKKHIKQIVEGASARLGTTSNVVIKDLNLTELTRVAGGFMYASGRGVPEDDAQGADQGHADAQSTLGFLYATGRGVPQDDMEAVAWFRRAADKGLAQAQFDLSGMYATGRGVARDDVEALKWVSLAASRVNGDKQKAYAAARDRLVQQMTPEQRAQAQRLAKEWQATFEKRKAG